MSPIRLVTRGLLIFATSLMFAAAATIMWAQAPEGFFGGDHVAYREGAARLISTGSPYHPILLAGPIANHIDNVPIAYLYPPVLAQLFVPLVGVDPVALNWVTATIQAVLLVILLPLVYRRFAGRLTIDAALTIWLATTLSLPIHMALFGGNLSGWITIGVAVMLISQGRGGGAAAAIAALLKMTPLVLVVPALLYRPTRVATLITLLGVSGVSVVLSPTAWLGWLTALPSIVMFPTGDGWSNFAPAVLLGPYGLGWLGSAISYAIGGTGLLASMALAWRGHWPAAVAAGVAALLFVTGSTWDHYLAPTLPLVVAVLALPNRAASCVVIAYVAMSHLMWYRLQPLDLLRVCYLGAAVGVSAALIVLLMPRSVLETRLVDSLAANRRLLQGG